MATFDELGIPFPLFRADAKEAGSYERPGACALCQAEQAHRFRINDLVLACPACGADNALSACDGAAVDCRACGGSVPFPLPDAGEILVCHACLRAGKAAISQNTELGMVRWEDALAGRTHGLPVDRVPGYETVPVEGDEGWRAVVAEQRWLFELTRTPGYSTWQGEQWQWCCQRPMAYLGPWDRADFNANARNGDGRALFDEIVPDASDALWEDRMHDVRGIYVFVCPSCQGLKAHWDMA